MANNRVSSLLNVELPKPKRSNFNLGRVNRFSADVGWLIPCYVEEILPNSYKRLDIEGLIQTNATVAPLMGSFKVKVDAFFIPRRLYHQHLDINNIRPGFSDDFTYHYLKLGNFGNVPSVSNGYKERPQNFHLVSSFDLQTFPPGQDYGFTSSTNLQCAPGSLLDYLGYLPVGWSTAQWSDTLNLDALPFIGYFDIFRNFYANPHDPYVPFRIRNFTSDTVSPGHNNDYSVDRYLDLSSFDKFISSIVKGSIDNNGSPIPLNIINTFYTSFKFISTPRAVQSPTLPALFEFPPLFAGQAVDVTNDYVVDIGYPLSDTRDGRHFGLLRRTYMDDYFTARFRNEFVTYLEESSRVQVRESDNTFNIKQLRIANAISKYVDKSIFSDTRFGSWLKAHFGVKTNAKLCIPQFLGSITSNIVFNDIYASAQTGDGGITDNQALGSRASLGQGYLQNEGAFVEFKATEPGVLMCLFSIIPYTSYFQGIKKMYLKTSFSDMFTPEYDAIGYDDIQKLEMSAVPNYIQVYGETEGITQLSYSEYNIAVGKHPAWMEYMTSIDEAHGLLALRDQYGFWLLNRPFSPYAYDPVLSDTADFPGDDIQLVNYSVDAFDSSTYINPEYFNTIFAVDKFTDNFQVQLRFFDKTKQPISKQVLPRF